MPWAILLEADMSGAYPSETSLGDADLTEAKWEPDNAQRAPTSLRPPENAWDPDVDGKGAHRSPLCNDVRVSPFRFFGRSGVALIAGITMLGLGLLVGAVFVDEPVRSPLLEVGGALLSGAVLSTVFVVLERRIEQAVTEKQTRTQYQLALGMAETLADRRLAGLDLSGLQLPYQDFTKSRLFETNLAGAYLHKANFSEVSLFRANLARANLSGANMTGAKLREANLTGANLTGANLTGANLTGANLTEALLAGADLSAARWDPEKNPPTWPEGFDPPPNGWDLEVGE